MHQVDTVWPRACIPKRLRYWLINTASLIDYPQQARALKIVATRKGVAIQTWMLDHVFPGELGTISRQLAYLHGFHDALRVGSLLCVAGAVVAVLAIRKIEHRHAPQPAPVVEAA